MTWQPGGLVDRRYRLERRIGTGGTSDVWAATDVRLERPVAVKLVRLDPDDQEGARRGPAEARLLAGLSHPGLVALYDAHLPVDGSDLPYLVMELVDGGTLAALVAAGPVDPVRVREVVGSVATALAYLHARDVIHRDVKPGNILFTRDGSAKLTDFGIARVVGSPRLTQTGLMMGTAPYLSPEQVRGEEPTSASDVYALGLVLLEALTAVRAYPGTASESAIARLTRRPAIPVTVPADLVALIGAMTADDPARRPPASGVARELGGSRGRADLPPTAVLTAPAAPRRTWRRPAAAWLALPLVAAVAVAVAVLAGSGHGQPAARPTPLGSSPSPVVATTSPAPLPVSTPPSHPGPPAGHDNGHDKGHGDQG